MAVPSLAARPWPKRLALYLEFAGAWLAFRAVRALPLDWASAAGGWVGRTVGPRLNVHKRAKDNLTRAFPDNGADWIAATLRAMWDNFGRSIFELPHMDRVTFDGPGARVIVRGLEHVEAVAARDGAVLFFGGHLANWELAPMTASQHGLDLMLVYRAANNPLVEGLIQANRARYLTGAMVPKGREGAKRLLTAVRGGRSAALLVDQKQNDGIAVPFFGREAMTAPALAQMALRFAAPISGVRVVRLEGCRFEVIVEPPFRLTDTGDRAADVLTAMTQVNAVLEDWIRDRPGQWFWMHNRWPKDG